MKELNLEVKLKLLGTVTDKEMQELVEYVCEILEDSESSMSAYLEHPGAKVRVISVEQK